MGKRYYRDKRHNNNYLDDDEKLFIGIAILVAGVLIIGGIAWFINNIILPYIWWIVGVSGSILLIAISFLIYFKIIKKHNIKKLENFVATNSEAIKKLEELNSRLSLKYVNNQMEKTALTTAANDVTKLTTKFSSEIQVYMDVIQKVMAEMN